MYVFASSTSTSSVHIAAFEAAARVNEFFNDIPPCFTPSSVQLPNDGGDIDYFSTSFDDLYIHYGKTTTTSTIMVTILFYMFFFLCSHMCFIFRLSQYHVPSLMFCMFISAYVFFVPTLSCFHAAKITSPARVLLTSTTFPPRSTHISILWRHPILFKLQVCPSCFSSFRSFRYNSCYWVGTSLAQRNSRNRRYTAESSQYE